MDLFIAVKPELHDDKQAKSKQVITCYFEHAGATGEQAQRKKKKKIGFQAIKINFDFWNTCCILRSTVFSPHALLGFSPLCEIMLGNGFPWCLCRFEFRYLSCTQRK